LRGRFQCLFSTSRIIDAPLTLDALQHSDIRSLTKGCQITAGTGKLC
jgi:hypothetical protein